jgi:2',3'-cyclic-nucleotide 2'-phosphodiesterase (5'-nucleotidase family)
MQAKADQLGVDLLLVDSGDVVDGNGFVDADNSGFKGHAARELLKLVEYDIATTGNHEVSEWSASERA